VKEILGKLHGLVFAVSKVHARTRLTAARIKLYIDKDQVIDHVVILLVWEKYRWKMLNVKTAINFPRKMGRKRQYS